MLAAVLYAPGDIRVEDVPPPKLTPGHALVRVAAVGVCGSDLPRILTKGAHRLPVIPGHEFSGTVVEVADDLDIPVGQRVTVPPLVACFDCAPCARGSFSLCRDYDYFGSRQDGAYAATVSVPRSNLVRVPDAIDDVAAASVDPAAIALHGFMRAGIQPGDRVAVVGAGPIGLFAVQWARILGASYVLALDVMDEKLELARELGADAGLPSDSTFDAEEFDLVIETSGVPVAQNQAVALAGPHGRVAFIGIPVTDVNLELSTFNRLLRQEITLVGVWNSFSAPFPGREWTTSLDMMARGRLRTAQIVSHREPLERLPDMVRWMGQREGFFSKVMFFPNGVTTKRR